MLRSKSQFVSSSDPCSSVFIRGFFLFPRCVLPRFRQSLQYARPDSNREPSDYESRALTIELR